MIISQAEAQQIILSHQRLLGSHFGSGKNAALSTIEQLGYVQIDTLAVITRAHHHTLWSRTNGYQENFLDELLQEKKIFEYWSHAASYLPMSQYRFSLPHKMVYAKGKSHWFGQDKKLKNSVLNRIKDEGALQAKDFEHKRKNSGQWYEWKPAKKALEQLFMEGKLMVVARKNFQKIYDLTERVLPSNINVNAPDVDEYAQHLILNAINAFGIVTPSEISYLRGYARSSITKNIKYLLKEGNIDEIKINIDNSTIYYGLKNKCESLLNHAPSQDYLHILSPFDNLIIQRKRLQQLFNFNYIVECYVPDSKRQYGYFCLPVMYNNEFIARFDPKVDRVNKIFYIKSFHIETNWKMTKKCLEAIVAKIKLFAQFNGCKKIVAENTPAFLRKMF